MSDDWWTQTKKMIEIEEESSQLVNVLRLLLETLRNNENSMENLRDQLRLVKRTWWNMKHAKNRTLKKINRKIMKTFKTQFKSRKWNDRRKKVEDAAAIRLCTQLSDSPCVLHCDILNEHI